MKEDHQRLLRQLLVETRVLSLAVLVESKPFVGLLPFVVRPDFSAVLIHASDLARHTRGLSQDAPFSVLLQIPDRSDADPLQLPRVSLEGEVRVLERGTSQYDSGKELYLSRFPGSAQTFSLGDFRLYELELEKGRLVAGFAQAATVTGAILRELGESWEIGGLDDER